MGEGQGDRELSLWLFFLLNTPVMVLHTSHMLPTVNDSNCHVLGAYEWEGLSPCVPDPMPVLAKLHFPPGVGVSTTLVHTLRHLCLEQPQPQLVPSVTVGLILLEFCL